MTPQETRENAAAFVRSIDPHAFRLWEVNGVPLTSIHALEAWQVKFPDRHRVVIVQIFGERGLGDGWAIYPEIGPNDIDGTRAALMRLGEIEK